MRLDGRDVKRALDARLSALDADPARRARVRERIAKEEQPVKRKMTVSLAFALIAALALTGAALAAAGVNVFEYFAARDAPVVVQMEFQRLVGIAADEREAVRALDFKGGEMSVEQVRLRALRQVKQSAEHPAEVFRPEAAPLTENFKRFQAGHIVPVADFIIDMLRGHGKQAFNAVGGQDLHFIGIFLPLSLLFQNQVTV